MKSCDLTSGGSKLELALKSFRATLSAVEQHWTDDTHRKFQETHLAIIEPNVKRMFDAIARMAEAIGACERQCDEEGM
jgi:hypothetical protein